MSVSYGQDGREGINKVVEEYFMIVLKDGQFKDEHFAGVSEVRIVSGSGLVLIKLTLAAVLGVVVVFLILKRILMLMRPR